MSKDLIKFTQSTDVVIPESTAGYLPDDGDLLSPPRFKVLAPLSRQVKDEQGKDGQIWSDAHGAVIGGVTKKKPLEVAPVLFVPIMWQRSWVVFDDNLNLVFQTQDPDSPLFQEHGISEDDKWKHKRLMLLMMAPLNHPDLNPELGIMSFGSTMFKAGRALYRAQRMRKVNGVHVPLYMQAWEMGLKPESNAKGDWFVPDCRYVGVMSDPNDYASFAEAADQYADTSFAETTPEAQPATQVQAEDDIPF